MTIGRTASQSEFNQVAASLAATLFSTMDDIGHVKATLDTMSVPDLQTLGFSGDDANLLKSIFTDLDKIRAVFQGQDTATPAYDFRTFAKRLLGVGIY